MRAAGTTFPPFGLGTAAGHRAHHAGPSGAGCQPSCAGRRGEWGIALGLGTLLLPGYVGGIVAVKLHGSDLGASLAQYYLDAEQYERFSQVFLALFAGAFLQLSALLLCGFSAVGGVLLGVGFAGKGWVLGTCAASVYVAGAQRGLVVYWLLTCLPDLGLLWLLVWFALHVFRVCGDLTRFVFGPQGHARLQPNIRSMLIRYCISLGMAAAISAVGAASAVLFAGVLL